MCGIYFNLNTIFKGSLFFPILTIIYNILIFLAELFYFCYKVIIFFLKKSHNEIKNLE